MPRSRKAPSPHTGAIPTRPDGVTTHPEGETATGHDACVEESPDLALANGAGGGATPAAEGASFDLVRNSGKFEVDLADLAYDRQAHIRGTCDARAAKRAGKKLDGAPTCRACLLFDLLYQVRRDIHRVQNKIVRELWRLDAAALDRTADELGRFPISTKEWKPAKEIDGLAVATWAYRHACTLMPQYAAGAIVAQAANEACQKWRECAWDVLVRNAETVPQYKEGGSFRLRRQDVKLERYGDGYHLLFSILRPEYRDRKGWQFALPIRARDGYQKRVLAALAAEEWKLGTIQFKENPRKPGRWLVSMSYTRRMLRSTSEVTAAIHRGMKAFLTLYTSDGDAKIHDGAKIQAHLAYIQSRRKEYQRDLAFSNRAGHGRARALKPIEKLQDAGRRWREQQSKVIAARSAEWFASRDVSMVYLDDFTGIRDTPPDKIGQRNWELLQEWPYYRLKQDLIIALENVGISHMVIPRGKKISITCPECGHEDEQSRDWKRLRFRCTQCSYRDHLEVATARNVHASGEVARKGRSSDSGSLGDGENGKTGTARKRQSKKAKPQTDSAAG